jgi:hypothetical protein
MDVQKALKDLHKSLAKKNNTNMLKNFEKPMPINRVKYDSMRKVFNEETKNRFCDWGSENIEDEQIIRIWNNVYSEQSELFYTAIEILDYEDGLEQKIIIAEFENFAIFSSESI